MSATIACPVPLRCRSISHVPGSAAARSCPAASSPRLPLLAALPDSVAALSGEVLARPHPSGGYDQVQRAATAVGATTIYLRDGLPHRGDGPSVLDTDALGRVVGSAWHRDGLPHRDDGPAVERPGVDLLYALEGEVLGGQDDHGFVQDLLAAGARLESVVWWLKIEDRSLALELAGRVDPQVCADLIARGLTGAQDLLAAGGGVAALGRSRS